VIDSTWFNRAQRGRRGSVAECQNALGRRNADRVELSREPYAAFIEAAGQPALELGCGDGEPLLELLRRGYDVDGVDSSQGMLDRL
jgi:SAM-dependent methyltransferase